MRQQKVKIDREQPFRISLVSALCVGIQTGLQSHPYFIATAKQGCFSPVYLCLVSLCVPTLERGNEKSREIIQYEIHSCR